MPSPSISSRARTGSRASAEADSPRRVGTTGGGRCKLTSVIGLVLILALGLVATVGQPQPARAAAHNLVLIWNEAVESVRKLPLGPTVTARTLAVLHTASRRLAAYDPVAVDSSPGFGSPHVHDPSGVITLGRFFDVWDGAVPDLPRVCRSNCGFLARLELLSCPERWWETAANMPTEVALLTGASA
jgi:hypothetical protein